MAGITALATGASRGIGRAAASAPAARGAHVMVHFRSGAVEAENVIAQITQSGGRVDAVFADLAAADGAHSLAAQARTIVGERLDILAANAGIYKAAALKETIVAPAL